MPDATIRTGENRSCPVCGASFYVPPNEAARRKTCSRRCTYAMRHAEYERTWVDVFWSKVAKGDGCWEWQGARFPDGYGVASMDGKSKPAHRVSWTINVGPIPAGLHVRHYVCDNPPCVRPDHLRLGTNDDNIADKVAHGRTAIGRSRPRGIHRGEANPKAKVSEEQVREMRRLHATGMNARAIARQMGVGYALVYSVVAGRRWQHIV